MASFIRRVRLFSIQSGLRRCSSVGALLLLLALPAPAAQFSQARPTSSKVQVEAPEINPSLVKGLAVLLIGGVLVLTSLGRRRRTYLELAMLRVSGTERHGGVAEPPRSVR